MDSGYNKHDPSIVTFSVTKFKIESWLETTQVAKTILFDDYDY